MSTTKDYCDFILEQLSDLNEIDYRPMMGEYLLYYQGVLFGGIYDNRLLVKKTINNAKFNLPEVIPYDKAKPMYQIEDLDDRERMHTIIVATYQDLKK
jgi:TfoX/Sxy family transcriptional regulator of competence genes